MFEDKVWQCEHFLERYQEDLEAIAEYAQEMDDEFFFGAYQYQDESAALPVSVKAAMDTYFHAKPNGQIKVLNDATKWAWSIDNTISHTELTAFEITSKPYMCYDDAGEKDWSYSNWYSLCYTERSYEQLKKLLDVPNRPRYQVLLTGKPNWFIVLDAQQW